MLTIRARSEGFTLLEVLVALAVIALAMGVAIKAGADNAANAGYLRDKTFAHWVALNKVTELRLEAAWPATGKRAGTEELADRRWRWQAVIEKTFDDDVRRVEVSVALDDQRDAVLVRRIGFLPRRD